MPGQVGCLDIELDNRSSLLLAVSQPHRVDPRQPRHCEQPSSNMAMLVKAVVVPLLV